MTERSFTESVVEQAALAWLEASSWRLPMAPTSRRTCSLPSDVILAMWYSAQGFAMLWRG